MGVSSNSTCIADSKRNLHNCAGLHSQNGVNCRNMITSRTPDDLTPFCLAIIDAVAAAGS